MRIQSLCYELFPEQVLVKTVTDKVEIGQILTSIPILQRRSLRTTESATQSARSVSLAPRSEDAVGDSGD